MVPPVPRNLLQGDRKSRRNMTLQRSRSLMIWRPQACYVTRQSNAEVTDGPGG
jgi:hypothetical protein